MAAASDDNRISGGRILREVRTAYQRYQEPLAASGKGVAIVRFEAALDDPPSWRARMEASHISARQKVRSFSYLGLNVEHVVLPPTVSAPQFAGLIDRLNDDPQTAAIIVQFPPPVDLLQFVEAIDPGKDIDALLEERSPHPACATAEGIWRITEPFVRDDPQVAVVGSNGFVGGGVVRLLQQHGVEPLQLDLGDDLRQIHDADVVISVTGNARLLGPEHLQPHHRLVVDSGFVPQPDGAVYGDVKAEAYAIPQYITPVPGGTGPVEMAVLMERIVRQEVDPNLEPWQYQGEPYQPRAEMRRDVIALSTDRDVEGDIARAAETGRDQDRAADEVAQPTAGQARPGSAVEQDTGMAQAEAREGTAEPAEPVTAEQGQAEQNVGSGPVQVVTQRVGEIGPAGAGGDPAEQEPPRVEWPSSAPSLDELTAAVAKAQEAVRIAEGKRAKADLEATEEEYRRQLEADRSRGSTTERSNEGPAPSL